MTLHLLTFNNYYNRQIKVYPTIDEYPGAHAVIEYINFNPNDGISTEQVINYTGPTPDYLICTDDNEIVSRWFVIQTQRTRAQQYKMTLYRDLVADHLEQIIDAPMFVEKATLTTGNDLIFNDEAFTTNQVKTSETLLTDPSGCPWIVGYLASDTPEINTTFSTAQEADIQVEGLSNWELYEYSNYGNKMLCSKVESACYNLYAQASWTDNDIARIAFGDSPAPDAETINADSLRSAYAYWTEQSKNTSYSITSAEELQIATFYLNRTFNWEGFRQTVNEQLPGNLPIDFLTTGYDDYNGKIIYDTTTGRTYKISIGFGTSSDNKQRITAGNLYNTLVNLVTKTNDTLREGGINYSIHGSANDASFMVNYTVQQLKINLERVYTDSYRAKIVNGEGRTHLVDAPYDMFCMPYSDDLMIYLHPSLSQVRSSKEINLRAAVALTAGSGEKIWDIQLVPYCPLKGSVRNGVWDISKFKKNYIYELQEDGNDGSIAGAIVYCPVSKFDLDLDISISVPTDAVEFKVANQCDMYRLCSPNYSGMFEFSATKNNGVDWIHIDCQYKPFQPYIHVNPNFKRLYGKEDFKDARGLICGGDFSLPILTSAWATYEMNNKNYQKQFDRQIQNMETQHKYQKIQEVVGIGTGALTGAASGALLGTMIPGIGNLAGGLIGGAASLAGGITDYKINNALRAEALDYTKDQFGYQLDNIKALPESLTRVSSFNNNNKIFPFIEYYTCTDVEKEALRNKLKYNGFTVGVIGTLGKFRQPTETYIKGKLIRLDKIEGSFEIANALSAELNKGVFI